MDLTATATVEPVPGSTVGIRWSVDDSQPFALHAWDGEAVVYIGASANTHLLSPAASAVLTALLDPGVPGTFDHLLDSLASQDDRAADAALAAEAGAALQAILLEFERFGFVKQHIS